MPARPRSAPWPGWPPGRPAGGRPPRSCRARAGAPSARPSARARAREAARGRTWIGPRRCPPGPGRGCPGPGGPLPRCSALLGGHDRRELREGRRIRHGELGQDLAVERYAGLLEPGHEDRVGETELAARGVDANDPESARAALLLLPPPVGEGPGAQHRLGGCAVELAAPGAFALCLLEDLLPALAGLGPALCPWHVRSPFLEVRDEPLQPRHVSFGDQPRPAELAPPLGALRLQEVLLPSAPGHELAGARRLESLGGGPLRLHLWHVGGLLVR